MLKAKLIVVGGDAKAGEVNLKLPTTIGRGKEASLTLPHPLVSRLHCEITEKDGKLLIKDLGSLNGTFVNNQRIEGERLLEPEQLLTLGNVTFRAFYTIGVHYDEVEKVEMSDSIGFASAEQTQPEPAPMPAIEKSEHADEVPKRVEKETVYDDSKNDSDTDHSGMFMPEEIQPAETVQNDDQVVKSDVFVEIVDEDNPPANRSVSVNALDDLETEEKQAAALSFAGGIELDDSADQSKVDAFQIELGDDSAPKSDSRDDSKLGSFIRKLPK